MCCSSRKNSTSSLTPSVNVMALHPVEVARQLTLVDFELLEKVEPLDFLRASKGEHVVGFFWDIDFFLVADANKATTVRGLTARFNRTSLWIATEGKQARKENRKLSFVSSQFCNRTVRKNELSESSFSSVWDRRRWKSKTSTCSCQFWPVRLLWFYFFVF